MPQYRWIITVLLALAALQISACGSPTTLASSEKPAKVEASDQAGINRVVLTERAAQRLGIETEAIREEMVDGAARMVAPYSSVIYDTHGGTWLYTVPEPLTYMRHPIDIDYISGEMAILTAGPPLGTEVATVGVAELYGTDTGVGK